MTPEFEPALWVVGTVISRHGRQGVLDNGHKSVSSHHSPPEPSGVELDYVDEEHLGFRGGRSFRRSLMAKRNDPSSKSQGRWVLRSALGQG